MIDTGAIKDKIIQLAVTGKLTFQQEDGKIDELLEKIYCERKELNINTDIPLITEGDKKYSIPLNWTWVKLGNLVIKEIKRGKAPKYTEKSSVQVFAQKCNLKKGGINMNLALYLDENKKIKYSESDYMQDEDIVINSTGTGTMGRVGFFNNKDRINNMEIVPDSHITTVRLSKFLVRKFVYYVVKQYQPILEGLGVGSTNQRELRPDTLMNLIIPLPPFEEQKRICEKVEKIFNLLDIIDVLQAQYSSNLEILKNKIIDAGIQGKLTEQLFEDGNAKEIIQQINDRKNNKQQEESIKEDIMFEIPSNWCWIKLGNIFQHNTGKALNSANTEGIKKQYITTSNVYWNRFELDNIKEMYFKDSEIDKCTVVKEDLLICEGGDIGRAAIWDKEYSICIQNHIHRLRPLIDGIKNKYYYYVMYLYKINGWINGRGIGLQGLSSKRLHNLIVPLPPIEEQKRIVEKIDSLMAILENI